MLGGKLFSKHKASVPLTGTLALLMHNNTGSFLDSSSYAHPISSYDVSCVASPVKFGAGSAEFTGASRLSVPNGVLNTLGAGDFTIEMFVNFNSIRMTAPSSYSATMLIDNATANSGVDRGWGFVARNVANTNSHGLTFVWSLNGTSTSLFAADYTFSTGVWYHVAVTREGNTLRLFVNGQVIGTKTDMSGAIYSNTKASSIGDFQEGSWAGTWGLNGYIDEIRVVKGQALYTANFTVPSAEFSA